MGMTDKKKYRAVVVALDAEEGILSANRADSYMQANHIVLDSIYNLLDDDGYAQIRFERDGFDDSITNVKFFNKDGDPLSEIDYKYCFNDPKEEQGDGNDNPKD